MKRLHRQFIVALAVTLGTVILVTTSNAGMFPFGYSGIRIEKIGGYAASGAEISAYDSGSGRLFVVTGGTLLEILDLSRPSTLGAVATIDVSSIGGGANSVAVHDGIVAVAIENNDKTQNGFVAFYDTDGSYITTVTVGALPDMLTFTPNGKQLVVANEGEPDDDYYHDPEGSISVIDLSNGVYTLDQSAVTTIGFADFNAGGSRHDELNRRIRIFGPYATVAQDLEPEYITVEPDSKLAWVSFQENNALGIIDLGKKRVRRLVALGYKDHGLPGNALDASDRDGAINIANWPVLGMYQPDAIANYSFRGKSFIVTANEGDARDYGGFSEETRVKDLVLDLDVFPDAAELQEDDRLGRLKTTLANGDDNKDGLNEKIYSYGTRSFSIWTAGGQLVYDSGDEFAALTAAKTPILFNAEENDPGEFDSRSDDKGAEPEGVVLGQVFGRTYAFIGLERIGGIMVYDITRPFRPSHVQYLPAADGDVSPEGMLFIPASQSPVHTPLLVVSYEGSGTVAVFGISHGARKGLPVS